MLKLLPGNISFHNKHCESDNSWRRWIGKHNWSQATSAGCRMLSILCTTSGMPLLTTSPLNHLICFCLFMGISSLYVWILLYPAGSQDADVVEECILHGLGLRECRHPTSGVECAASAVGVCKCGKLALMRNLRCCCWREQSQKQNPHVYL